LQRRLSTRNEEVSMMVKPNLPRDERALDQERAASMADEGGAAGASVESQDSGHDVMAVDRRRAWRPRVPLLATFIVAAVTVGFVLWTYHRGREA
jgi:hypothetical protein